VAKLFRTGRKIQNRHASNQTEACGTWHERIGEAQRDIRTGQGDYRHINRAAKGPCRCRSLNFDGYCYRTGRYSQRCIGSTRHGLRRESPRRAPCRQHAEVDRHSSTGHDFTICTDDKESLKLELGACWPAVLGTVTVRLPNASNWVDAGASTHALTSISAGAPGTCNG